MISTCFNMSCRAFCLLLVVMIGEKLIYRENQSELERLSSDLIALLSHAKRL